MSHPTRSGRKWRKALRQARDATEWLLVLLALSTILAGQPPYGDLNFRAAAVAREHTFGATEWEIGAVAFKLRAGFLGLYGYLDEPAKTDLLLSYMELTRRHNDIQWQITRIYADPSVADPETESANLQTRLNETRALMSELQAAAEATIESRVSVILAGQGLGILGGILPPVSMHFSPIPRLLVLSPRDEIRFAAAVLIDPDISLEEIEALEAEAEAELDMSALVVPIAGLSLYPALVLESGDLAQAYEVAAHEWTHHYLDLFPLGASYNTSDQMRTINESVAGIVGEEVAWLVMQRYHPDLAGMMSPPEWLSAEAEPEQAEQTNEPVGFDFAWEMHRTRRMVDILLAAGRISEAETYMERRRRFFWEHGFVFRKMNQAFFAFYGGYQASGTWAVGEDVIGSAVRELRRESENLAEFLARVRWITSPDELPTPQESGDR